MSPAWCDRLQIHGLCTCRPGFQGPSCEYQCPNGYYGQNCSQICQCVYGSCNPASGSCTCNPGFTGSYCSQTCPQGWSNVPILLRWVAMSVYVLIGNISWFTYVFHLPKNIQSLNLSRERWHQLIFFVSQTPLTWLWKSYWISVMSSLSYHWKTSRVEYAYHKIVLFTTASKLILIGLLLAQSAFYELLYRL